MQMTAGFTANVWDIKVKEGDKVTKDQVLIVLEAMKMESPVASPVNGTVKVVAVEQGTLVPAGELLVVVEEE